ncbi:DUF393 domain-containing protein [Piscinibacter gummiphilus]|uniref:DUF393 domain-containing protein n=1 Tax=Piscinibacter gummiphilus TaxID=946333 RepID=A0ABZ0CV86_9BURK|nr:DUF393 domain-containing protein [Piscinibacter gummiphilus]WOB08798.1 DUF393 domain-containing protein [Piscinibacter gummiphilus]
MEATHSTRQTPVPPATAEPAPDAAATVYYNSACPVCDAGIRSQRERMQGCNVHWVDVHQNPQSAQALGLDLEQVRERLHVRAADGHMHIGADALAALWSQSPGQRWLGALARRLRWLGRPLYNAFARGLYRWNRRRGHW